MFMRKMAACLTGAVLVALTLPLLAGAQTQDVSTENSTPAAHEAAKEPGQPNETDPPKPENQPTQAALTPEPSPSGAENEKTAKTKGIALLLNGKDVSGGTVTLDWPGEPTAAPTMRIQAIGPDGQSVTPEFSTSNPSVASVDASGIISAIGCGVATVIARLDAKIASFQITVGRKVDRVVIIAEDSVSPGHSIKLRAFDQDGNRISVLWRSSSEKIARVNEDGVLTARRGASGQSVEVTALAGEGSDVFAVKTIQID